MRIIDDIQVKQNVFITMRERGKIVERREGHNIFVDLGREWLSQLIAYQAFGPPDVTFRDDRVKYMGFGIGGTRQLALGTANSAPLGSSGDPYEAGSYTGIGSNAQTDVDPTVTTLERPVRVIGGVSNYPGLAGDRWIEQIQAPPEFPTGTSVTFKRLFQSFEVSYGTFTSVPMSEIGLYTAAASPENYLNTLVAYDTFDTLSKTSAFELEVRWTLSF